MTLPHGAPIQAPASSGSPGARGVPGLLAATSPLPRVEPLAATAQEPARRVGELSTPVVTLSSPALHHNAATLASWAASAGVLLAPHGKTTMSPRLWRLQEQHGAWGITLATVAQLRVAREHGFDRLLLANSLVAPADIAWVAREVAAGARILSWVDSPRTLDLLVRHAGGTPLEVIVELGGDGGRTGVRSLADATDLATLVADTEGVLLAGVGGYEGALAHSRDEAELETVRSFLRRLARLHAAVSARYEVEQPFVTAGGSAFFDLVAEELVPAVRESSASVVVRAGAYLVHDEGFCEETSPFGAGSRLRFTSAMTGWAHVVSQPEPGLAIINAGKRDLSFDVGMPRVAAVADEPGGSERPFAAEVTELNDQHGFVRFDPLLAPPLIGQVLRLQLSHPCTVMDKWASLPVVDGAGVVVDRLRTFF